MLILMCPFFVCYCYISDIAILPRFRMIVVVVLGLMFCRCLCCIIATTTLVWWLEWL